MTTKEKDLILGILTDYELGGKISIKTIEKILSEMTDDTDKCAASCVTCQRYNKEKHFCPLWCNAIKRTVDEISQKN